MKRVLILANNDIGLYKFRKELLQELVKKYEVYISLPDGDFIFQLQQLGCQFIDTPIERRGSNPVTDLQLLINYRAMIKKVKPTVVLTYTIKPNIYGGFACRMAGVPYISNITGLGSAVEGGGMLQTLILILYRRALKRASCLFFQNKDNQEFFRKKNIVCDNQLLIPGSGVNLEYYQVLDYPADNKINFLFISRVMKEKGIEQYLDAAKFIRTKYPNTVFHVLGFCEEGYEEKLKVMQEQGIIKYHGMQNDIRDFHKMSHCTVHPSFYPEGISNVLLESAACGRPIITTNRSGCREVVDDAINGYIVNQRSSQDLIEKIEKFLSLDYEQKRQMGLAGRKKIESEFDRQIVVSAYLAKIGSIC